MENRIRFDFEARYEVLGEPNKKVEELWIVCHGHGQLAKYFIRKFQSIANEKRLIVAPEGLFRYYLEGFTGRVGATWMTKEDRVSDINNYITFLSAVYKEVRAKLSPKVKITFLGFSQGAATISRLATMTELKFDRLILWAGIFPPDLPPLQSTDRLKDKQCYLVYGLEDQFLTEARIKEQESIASQIQVTPKTITFEGQHELNDLVLDDLAKRPYLHQ